MTSIDLNLPIILVLSAVFCVSCQSRQDDQAEHNQTILVPVHPGVKIDDGLYDTTAALQARFGLNGKLAISQGRKDIRPSYADAPTELSFRAVPTEPGWYCFVFVRVDGFEKPKQIVAVHLLAIGSAENSKPPRITPTRPHARYNHAVAPNEPVDVQWNDYDSITPLGGGWRLVDVVYTDSTDLRNKPDIPGYDYRGGI